MKYGFCKDKWPLVVLTAEGTPESEEEMNDYIQEWKDLYNSAMMDDVRFKLIIDIRELDIVQVKYIKMMANFLIKIKPLTEKWMDRTGILVSRESIKMIISLVLQFYEAVRPYKVFNDAEECFSWITSHEKGEESKGRIMDMKEFPNYTNTFQFK
jgi:hypothetical protein